MMLIYSTYRMNLERPHNQNYGILYLMSQRILKLYWENNIYLLTPWNRVLLEKLTGFAASQEIPRIYGTRKFITVLKSARHLSLSWARSIQSPQLPPTSWRSILILSSHLRLGLPNGLFPSVFLTKMLTLTSPIRPHYLLLNLQIFTGNNPKTLP
jgi:hypothetical protein